MFHLGTLNTKIKTIFMGLLYSLYKKLNYMITLKQTSDILNSDSPLKQSLQFFN